MPLEQEEIDAIKTSLEDGKFAEHPELKKLSELGLKLHTDKTFGEAMNQQVEEAIKPKIREVHTKYEEDIKNLTGMDKKPNEKAYDYLKRAVPEFAKSKAGEEMKTLQDKIADLEKVISEKGDPSGALQKKLEEAETKYKTSLEALQTELKTERENVSSATKKRLLSEAHSPIKSKYRSDLPSYFYTTEKQILAEALANSVVVEDEKGDQILVEADSDGNPKKDNQFKFIPVTNQLENAFKDAIKVDPKKGGSGAGGVGGDPINPDEIDVKTWVMPESVKTKSDLTTVLLEMGLAQGDEKFDELYDKHSVNLKSFR